MTGLWDVILETEILTRTFTRRKRKEIHANVIYLDSYFSTTKFMKYKSLETTLTLPKI